MTFELRTLVQKCRIKKRVNIKKKGLVSIGASHCFDPFAAFSRRFPRQNGEILTLINQYNMFYCHLSP